MTPDRLAYIGKALWPDQPWTRRMATALGVNPRTTRAWNSGRMIVPEGVERALEKMLQAHLS